MTGTLLISLILDGIVLNYFAEIIAKPKTFEQAIKNAESTAKQAYNSNPTTIRWAKERAIKNWNESN